MVARSGAQAIFEEVCALAATRLPAHYDLAPVGDVQVLAPMHKGPVGVEALNAELRARLNPDGRAIPQTSFRLDDRVIQTRNSYELELMNGELGVFVSHDAQRGTVLMAADDGRRLHVPVRELSSFQLAYATSVHKAQGSQVPVVVVPLFGGHRMMLTRNLLYTAVTRAERATVLVGEPAALDFALARRDAHRRHTRLAEMVAP